MELLTIDEIVKLLHLKNRKTIDNWLYNGTIPRGLTVKIGHRVLFFKDKFEEFIRSKTV